MLDQVAAIARSHSVALRDVLGRSRTLRVVEARRVAMAYARSLGLSYPEVGALFGRDHSSVMFALGAVTKVRPRRRVA